jgi:hypothetical protein
MMQTCEEAGGLETSNQHRQGLRSGTEAPPDYQTPMRGLQTSLKERNKSIATLKQLFHISKGPFY